MLPDIRRSLRPEGRFRCRQLVAGAAAVAALAGCDIPTEPPQVETRWIVPAEETRFGVAELLPGDVSLTADSTAFVVNFDPVSFSATLGDLCAACLIVDGQTVPKPAFIGSASSSLPLPAEVVAFQVIGGEVEIQITNGLNFDPIRPADGVFGSLSIAITDESDGEVIGSGFIEGAAQGFPPGSTLLTTVQLEAASVEGDIGSTVTVDSPTGDPVTIDASLPVSFVATPQNVRVGSVEIDVASQSVTLDPVSLDVGAVDTTVVNRVVSGDFVIDVTNPFAVAADFGLTISGPTIATIQKSASIGSDPESSVTLSFTGEEIRSFLGEPDVVLSGGAVVDASAGSVTVSPGEELVLNASLDLVLRIGG